MSDLATQPARASGEFAIGGDLPIVRLGYGAMQGALHELQAEGKSGRIGLSEVSESEIHAARAITLIATVQNLYNLSHRSAEPVLDYCEREGIGFVPWFPMATGRLAQQRSPVLLPIPGTSTVAHLEENVAAAAIELTQNQVQQLNTAEVDS